MKNNISFIAFTFFFSQPWAHSERITFENIDPKSFQEFVKPTRPQTTPKVEVVTPVAPVPKVVPVAKAVPVTKPAPVASQQSSQTTTAPKVEAVKTPQTPKVEAVTSLAPVPKVVPRAQPVAASSESKTLIIGDSLSSSFGKFGPGIGEALSKNGNEACLYSVSGSRFDQWSGRSEMKNPIGSSETHYKDSNGLYTNYTKNETSPQNWNLEKLLASHSCGNPQKKFTNLVIQLGTNHDENYSPVKDLDKIFALAKANGIQDIKFILPPNTKNLNFQKLNAKIQFYLLQQNSVKASYFDTTKRVAIQNSDLRSDGVHFYNTLSEKNWTSAVQSWIQDSNRLVIEKPVMENPEHLTVKNTNKN